LGLQQCSNREILLQHLIVICRPNYRVDLVLNKIKYCYSIIALWHCLPRNVLLLIQQHGSMPKILGVNPRPYA